MRGLHAVLATDGTKQPNTVNVCILTNIKVGIGGRGGGGGGLAMPSHFFLAKIDMIVNQSRASSLTFKFGAMFLLFKLPLL